MKVRLAELVLVYKVNAFKCLYMQVYIAFVEARI